MTTSSAENNLHQWRSKAIDAFARAESAIDHLLPKCNLPAKGDLLSAKIERLRKAKPSSCLPSERKIQVDVLLLELTNLLPIRNDIVHAPMVIMKSGEQAFACFANPNVHCEYSRISREISPPRLQALASKAANLAAKLDAVSKPKTDLLTPASSPPPPSPDATAGP